ncbi:hypothetical protein BKA62DRAFT_676781 [Auriculariales sp. MPI-PUGE-AT-0066]|nr:hypothetical protein BKA62DRAFT_676781 [Auriculariales sp. MPI-PUGE-AT-0066]
MKVGGGRSGDGDERNRAPENVHDADAPGASVHDTVFCQSDVLSFDLMCDTHEVMGRVAVEPSAGWGFRSRRRDITHASEDLLRDYLKIYIASREKKPHAARAERERALTAWLPKGVTAVQTPACMRQICWNSARPAIMSLGRYALALLMALVVLAQDPVHLRCFATFSFTGSSIEYWGNVDTKYGPCLIEVDDESQGYVSGHADALGPPKQLFSMDKLDPTIKHTIKIKVAGEYSPSRCELDRFVYTPASNSDESAVTAIVAATRRAAVAAKMAAVAGAVAAAVAMGAAAATAAAAAPVTVPVMEAAAVAAAAAAVAAAKNVPGQADRAASGTHLHVGTLPLLFVAFMCTRVM